MIREIPAQTFHYDMNFVFFLVKGIFYLTSALVLRWKVIFVEINFVFSKLVLKGNK